MQKPGGMVNTDRLQKEYRAKQGKIGQYQGRFQNEYWTPSQPTFEIPIRNNSRAGAAVLLAKQVGPKK